jgi:protocatechuate 3,4-dioxygenase beta subunit
MNTKILKMRIIFTFLLFIVLFSFTSFAQTYSISGTIRDESGAPIEGITVNIYGVIDGANYSQMATTDNNGYYIFYNVIFESYSYTITPYHRNYSFDPHYKTIEGLSSNQTADFVATLLPVYSISGTIRDKDGAPISNVKVWVYRNFPYAFVTTDNNGYYIFSDLFAGVQYQVVPSHNNYYFSPICITTNALNSDQTVDFIGTGGISYTISGKIAYDPVYHSSTPATVILSGDAFQTIETDAVGDYSFSGLHPGGNYTITPSYANHFFEPINRTFNNLNSNQTVNFMATAINYSISGIVRDSASGIPLSGISVNLRGDIFSDKTTNNNGYYGFSYLNLGGNYTVTPSDIYYRFNQPSITFNGLNSTQTDVDFNAIALPLYSISGTIRDTSGSPVSGVYIYLKGAISEYESRVTANNGFYTF